MKVETTQSERNRKSRQLNNLRRYVRYNFIDPVFITITLNSEGITKPVNSLIKALNRLGIEKLLLVSDYGSKNGRLHYHGFIEKALLNNETLFAYKGERISKHGKSNHIFDMSNTTFEKRFGFVSVAIPTENVNDIDISIKYMLKYVLKPTNESYQAHKIYKSHLVKVSSLNEHCLFAFRCMLPNLKQVDYTHFNKYHMDYYFNSIDKLFNCYFIPTLVRDNYKSIYRFNMFCL